MDMNDLLRIQAALADCMSRCVRDEFNTKTEDVYQQFVRVVEAFMRNIGMAPSKELIVCMLGMHYVTACKAANISPPSAAALMNHLIDAQIREPVSTPTPSAETIN